MPITPGAYDNNGDLMDYATIDTQLANARTWLNGGIVVADIAAGAVGREQVVRPRFVGTPIDGMIGRVMQRYGYVDNNTSGATNSFLPLAATRDRDSLIPFVLTPPDVDQWMTRHGSTIYVPVTSHLEISCQGMVQTRVGTGWAVPSDSEAAGQLGGRLLIGICSRDALEQGVQLAQDSSHEVYPQNTRAHFSCFTFTTLTAGHHDILLLYDRLQESGHTTPLQLDIRTVNWSVDVSPALIP